MSRVLVIYKSKYGTTKKYAEMLKGELESSSAGKEIICDITEAEKFDRTVLGAYDTVIFAGAVYAGGISGISMLKKNRDRLKGKRTAVFCVGVSPYDEKALEEVKKRNLDSELRDVPMFYGRGTWDESRMTFRDRIMCRMLQKMVAKQSPEKCEPWMKELLSAVGKKCDWTDRKYLQPLCVYIRQE
ncbi:flavodoxin [Lachnoclostridium sp. An169]|uniref:flavodoxin domain-containing protein n=1 Tax=Lachnoclostridium sp. An169 TaxID=1965569 RepID=UPI000B372F76|nr:flavodoxin domain-containing protein [Lachnoclostridium sp. An169]OUP79659.1 flavodoxin [Lachnoclostridium sp. An169]HJA66834.1 flavodoxin domain-containing protein [Candidatus Mediterraneibacter cottocaccae]